MHQLGARLFIIIKKKDKKIHQALRSPRREVGREVAEVVQTAPARVKQRHQRAQGAHAAGVEAPCFVGGRGSRTKCGEME